MISGSLIINGLRIESGDFHLVSGGIAHPELAAPDGALFYIRGELGFRPVNQG